MANNGGPSVGVEITEPNWSASVPVEFNVVPRVQSESLKSYDAEIPGCPLFPTAPITTECPNGNIAPPKYELLGSCGGAKIDDEFTYSIVVETRVHNFVA